MKPSLLDITDIRAFFDQIDWLAWPRVCQDLVERDPRLADYLLVNLRAEIKERDRKKQS